MPCEYDGGLHIMGCMFRVAQGCALWTVRQIRCLLRKQPWTPCTGQWCGHCDVRRQVVQIELVKELSWWHACCCSWLALLLLWGLSASIYVQVGVGPWALSLPKKRPSMEGEMATAIANPDFSAAFQALKCLADYNVFQWLLAENAKGTPVLTNELVAVYVLQWKPFMRGSRATAFLESFGDYQHRHRWSSRFRKGWGILYKKLRARSGLADGLAQERVDLFLHWSLW